MRTRIVKRGKVRGQNTIIIRTSIDEFISASDDVIADTVAELAIACGGETKMNIVDMNAVDTGNMLNSVYAELFSDFKGAPGRGRQVGTKYPNLKTGQVFSQKTGKTKLVENPYAAIEERPRNKLEAFTKVAANYAIYVHERGRPFLLKAFEATRPKAPNVLKRKLRERFG